MEQLGNFDLSDSGMETAGNASGSVKFDVREDEEQGVKLLETIELLTAAGYFRARIKGLSAFDKVVGGMVWCISLCNLDVDVNLLYSENSTIGQQIALTEKIVKLLPRLNCPHTIEPHQIQGLDFIHIFPVVQWLVKKAIEAKEELGDQLQQFACYQFDATHRLPNEEVGEKALLKSANVQNELQGDSAPKRIYKKRGDVHFQDDSQRVHSTLLEYGWKDIAALKAETSAATKDAMPLDEQSQKYGLDELADQEPRLSAAAVVSMIRTENIQRVAENYAKESKGMAAQMPTLSKDELEAQIAEMETTVEGLENEEAELRAMLDKERAMYDQLKDEQIKLESTSSGISEMQATTDKQKTERLRELLAEHDEIKQKEREFKEKCRCDLEEMDREIDRLSGGGGEKSAETDEDRSTANQSLAEAVDQLQKRRLELADLNRTVATLQRRLDETPSQIELNQYQRRFLELYNQMASKHRETKQFFTLHNTLVDVKTYIDKEIELLDNICNVQGLASQDEYKQSFLENLEKLFDGVRKNKNLVDRRHTEVKLERDTLRTNLQELIDKQRLYYKTVDDFQKECKKNEKLLQGVERCTSGSPLSES